MKHPPINETTRFRGGLKHYHRKGSQPRSSWEEWVECEKTDRPKRIWLRVLGMVLVILALIWAGVAVFNIMR